MPLTLEALDTENLHPNHWVARFGPEHHDYGQPYTGTALASIDGDTAIIRAHAGDVINRTEIRQFRQALKTLGVARVRWERKRATGSHYAGIKL